MLTIFWAARITTLANNPRLEHIKSWIRTFPAHFLCWRSWTYVFAPFCMDKCILRKKCRFCNMGARWHKILEFVPSCPIYGWLAWWCDFFPVGPTFEDHPQVFSQKGPAPWNLFLTPAPRPLQVTFVGWWSWTYVVVAFCKDKFIFSKKNCVLDFGRALALTQNSWICPIISYLWMVGLVMRLFSCGANLWRSSAGKGAGPFFGWIHADDLQRLAPQEKSRITRPTIHR